MFQERDLEGPNTTIDISEVLSNFSPGQNRPFQRRAFPSNLLEDDSETQDPTREQQNPSPEVMKELKELKSLMKEVLKNQERLEKDVQNLGKALGANNFQLAKSSHAANVIKIFANSYVQMGRFVKANQSKTHQLQQEFQNSPYGLKVEELMLMAEAFEKAKFTYWRAEERRRILGIGNWASLVKANNREMASKICGLLGVKFNRTLEKIIIRETALVRRCITEYGREDCKKDERFWPNFYTWKETKYGARGPTSVQWNKILAEE